jgi:hypothetical protein
VPVSMVIPLLPIRFICCYYYSPFLCSVGFKV